MAQPTVKTDQKGFTYRRFKEGDAGRRSPTDTIVRAGGSHKCPTYVAKTPPCSGGCPSGHDIRGWLAIVRGQEKPEGNESWQYLAFRRMTEANPFPAIMGRVCPAPCEDGCNRNQVEDHVGINAVEHFIGDWALENDIQFPKPQKETGKKIACVGGGPASLAMAYFARREGHSVTIIESRDQLGGWLRYGIPGYRTPRSVLDGEIQRILNLGVEVQTNTRVGTDISMDDLDKQYDAIFWGIGTQEGKGLPIDGWQGTPNCVSGVDFLSAFNEGRLQVAPKNMVVVGGGDTSIDVASVARRMGHITEVHEKDRAENVVWGATAHDVVSSARREGTHVTLTSLFPVEEMTAAEREVRDAKHEGVEIRGSIMPLEVIKDENGRAKALKMCECEVDKKGNPTPHEGTEFTLDADLIVAAIGQKGDLRGLESLDNGYGYVQVDKTYRVPGHEKHFTGGDAIQPHLITTAVGHARIACDVMDHYLEGDKINKRPKVDVNHFNLLEELHYHGLDPAAYDHKPHRGTSSAEWAVHNYEDRSKHDIIPWEKLFLGYFAGKPRNVRAEVQVGPDQVIGDFSERIHALPEEQATDEATRCMSCGMCFECDNCLVYCPYDAVKRYNKKERAMGRYVYTDYAACVGCHICHDVCPTGFIEMGLGE